MFLQGGGLGTDVFLAISKLSYFHLLQKWNPKGTISEAAQARCCPCIPMAPITYIGPCAIFLSSHTGALRPSIRTASQSVQERASSLHTGRSQLLHHLSFKSRVAEPSFKLKCSHSKAYLQRTSSPETDTSLFGRKEWIFMVLHCRKKLSRQHMDGFPG